MNCGYLVVNNVKLPIDASFEEAFTVAKAILRRASVSCQDVKFSIYRRSIDARNKDEIYFVYSVAAYGDFSKINRDRLSSFGISFVEECKDIFPPEGKEKLTSPPLIVGAGPCGLFCALILAERGYKPIVIERGGDVKEREAAINRLAKERILDTDTNIQFGAGGAGTFSDGKLVTRINDPLTSLVLDRFVEMGADPSIKYIAKPHIGTDRLSLIVEKMVKRIEELSGKVLYHTRFLSSITEGSEVIGVKTIKGDIACGALVLAVGHSARDTYKTLIESQFDIEAKNFSVGMRIEHKREDIDRALYGRFAGDVRLGAAEYNLSADTKTRGVYTFCMCPGGVVVPAASEEGGLVVNGMSYSDRSGKNSNSAVVCSVFREDYGLTPTSAIEFQRKIERDAFMSGGGNYSAPAITVGDFLSDVIKTEPKEILPTYMDGGVRLARPEEYLPSFVTDGIKKAIVAFGKKIRGFDAPGALLTGAETRTSAPIRIIRDPSLRTATGYKNIYPCGEGAGYAGGITSASVDGIRTALSIISLYRSDNSNG